MASEPPIWEQYSYTLWVAPEHEQSDQARSLLSARSDMRDSTKIINLVEDRTLRPREVRGVPTLYVKRTGEFHSGSRAIRFLETFGSGRASSSRMASAPITRPVFGGPMGVVSGRDSRLWDTGERDVSTVASKSKADERD